MVKDVTNQNRKSLIMPALYLYTGDITETFIQKVTLILLEQATTLRFKIVKPPIDKIPLVLRIILS